MSGYIEEQKATQEPLTLHNGEIQLKRRAKILKSQINGNLFMDNHSRVTNAIIGNDCQIMRDAIVRDCIIGNNCYIGHRSVINTGEPEHWTPDALGQEHNIPIRKVLIGNGVRIGFDVKILPGINIGDGAVIQSGAVVMKDVKEGQTVAGNPAEVV
jgi:acetyltransferase-like isoleucine patch superfamily enzyme